MQIKKLFIFLFVILLFSLCKEVKKEQQKEVEKIIPKLQNQKKLSPLILNNPQAKEMIQSIEKMENDFFSYRAKIKIVATFLPKKQKLNLSGQVFYYHKTKRMKIQLEHSFFGFKVASIITNGKKMELKIPKKKTISSRLGEIYLNEVDLYLPFSSIYFLLSNQNLSFFEISQAKIDLTTRKISFKSNKNHFSYFYNSQNILKRITINSSKQNLKGNIKIKKYVELPELLEIKLFRHTNQIISEIKLKIKKIL